MFWNKKKAEKTDERWGGRYRINKQTKRNGQVRYLSEERTSIGYGYMWWPLSFHDTCCEAEEYIEKAWGNKVVSEEGMTSCKK